jgi:hypothetical protein
MTDTIQADDDLGEAIDRRPAPTIHRRHPRRWLLAVGAAGVAVAGATAAIAVHAADHTEIERVEVPADPAVMKEAQERAQIAAWAIEHHLTGLSPESLRPAPHGPVPTTRFGPR